MVELRQYHQVRYALAMPYLGQRKCSRLLIWRHVLLELEVVQ